MLVGYVSDEAYAALGDVQVELKGAHGTYAVVRSAPSGAVHAEVPPGDYEICLARPGFGSKRVKKTLATASPVHFRLLADRLLGYAWPKWCRGGDSVEFRVHAV